MKELILITGVSKGLGHAITTHILENTKVNVVGISRTKTVIDNKRFLNYQLDLNNIDAITELISFLIENYGQLETLLFINNAGVIQPLGKVRNIDTSDVVENIHVNLVAPIVITNQLLDVTKKLSIVNISSGAAGVPISSWSSYCASKAGVKMFFDVMYKDKEIDLLNIDPGVLDTDMQAQIRTCSEEDFPGVDSFKKLKVNNELIPPEIAARKIIQQLFDSRFI